MEMPGDHFGGSGGEPLIQEKGRHKWVECRGWEDFKSSHLTALYGNLPLERGTFLFRGQGSYKYPLKSSFDRWFSGNRFEKRAASQRLLELFREEIIGLDTGITETSDSNKILALAQHHGVPTRLLDWTESPYIAAFFAFAGIPNDPEPPTHAAIWCLDLRETEVWSSESGARVLHVPPYNNERMRKQLGWFTLLNAPYDTLEEYVANFAEAPRALRQFQIPSADVRYVLADLEMMGLTYSAIYPGLDGSAKTAELRARWAEHPVKVSPAAAPPKRRSKRRSK